jgi:hypothetical protein
MTAPGGFQANRGPLGRFDRRLASRSLAGELPQPTNVGVLPNSGNRELFVDDGYEYYLACAVPAL